MRRPHVRPFHLTLLILMVVPSLLVGCSLANYERWSQRRWDSAGLAPLPSTTPDAVIQVYAARAWGWKGSVGVHTWISMKHAAAAEFERYEVVGWGVQRGAPAIRKDKHPPDGYWAGNRPEILLDRRGPEVEAIINRLEAEIAAYPYPHQYRTWPGPNSNTFIAHLARMVPELGLELPPTAVGKDYLGNGNFIARTPSGTGYQLSLLGLLGLAIGREEGLEVNLFGFIWGVDPLDLAIKFPGVGQVRLINDQ